MKKIKISQDNVDDILARIREKLLKKKVIPKQVTMDVNPDITLAEKDKPMVVFENSAYKKMNALVNKCSKEIGWYGVVRRGSEGKTFVIEDILLFPQTVTGVTVTTNDAEYATWLDTLDDDVFNHMRFYGHSHVYMQTNPSDTDTTHYEDILQNVQDFYIFGIFNKSGKAWFNIYDVENNILYDDKDIIYKYYVTNEDTWAEEQITKYVEEESVVVSSPSLKSKKASNIYPKKTPNNYPDYGQYFSRGYCDKYEYD